MPSKGVGLAPLVFWAFSLVGCTESVFLQTPDPLNVTVGAVAEFYCRAQDASVVFWTVNGIPVNQLPDPNISLDDGPLVDGVRTHVLRIMADVQHNNSMIQCRSFTRGLGETLSDPALLMVQGMCPAVQHSPLPLPAHETPPPLPPRSDSHSLPTTDEQLQSTPCPLPPPVEEPPPIPLSPRLSPSSPHLLIRQPSYSSTDTSEEAPSSPVEEPLSLPSPRRAPPPPPTTFLQVPISLNVTEGAVAEFFCRADVRFSFWKVNNTSVNQLDDPNIYPKFGPAKDGVRTLILHIMAGVQHNNSVIQCIVSVTNGEREIASDPALLMVQGPLAAPGNPRTLNMIGSVLQPVLLRWNAPFSLNITNVDPDISNYTVFITNLNTSRNGSETVAGTETEFVFTNLPGEDQNPCHVYAFTVTAMNLVGEGNSSEAVLGNIRGVPQAVPADRVDVTLALNIQSGIWTLSMEFELAPLDCPGAVPETFMVNITAADGSSVCVHSDMIAEPTSQGQLRISFTESINILIVNEVYDARVHAVNSVGNTPSNGFARFTTFDLQSVTVHLNGTITCQYVAGSAAKGCLVIAREGDNVVYAIVRIQESTNSLRLEESGDSPSYTVMGFDLEQNGVFTTQPAVIVRDASVMGTLQQELDITAVNMATATTEDDGLVCVSCTLIVGSDATGCVAILISLEDTGSQQLLSHSITQDQSGSFAQGCFPVFSSGNFSLAIFAVGSNGPLGTAPAHVATVTISEAATTPPPSERNGNTAGVIAGTITAVVVVLIISPVVVSCLYYLYHKRKGKKDESTLETVCVHETTRQPSDDDTYNKIDRNQQIMADSDETTGDQQQSQFAPYSQYSLLQPAEPVEAPPAYDTVAAHDDVREVTEKKPHYAELDAFQGPSPPPPPSQEVPVQYSKIKLQSEG